MIEFSFRNFLRDKLVAFLVLAVTFLLLLLFCLAFHLPAEVIAIIFLPIILALCIILISGYYRRRRFYRALLINLARLDQAYLVTETVLPPDFLEGEILYETLRSVDKSMLENISKITTADREFREYLELWIHEIKTPLTALGLLAEKIDSAELRYELTKVDNLSEQILYFMRANSPTKDYALGECVLSQIVKDVLLTNRTEIQLKNANIVTENLEQTVYSDVKWLRFMVQQILANSLKYDATEISFRAEKSSDSTWLVIRDNGIGIPEEDLPRIFEKSFTGQNGHIGASGLKSTGMGLYLVQNLAQKLGLSLETKSQTGKNSFTEIRIGFSDHDYYKNVR